MKLWPGESDSNWPGEMTTRPDLMDVVGKPPTLDTSVEMTSSYLNVSVAPAEPVSTCQAWTR